MRTVEAELTIKVRIQGTSNEFQAMIPDGTDVSGIRELVADRLGLSPTVLANAVIDRTEEGYVVRDQAPWG